MRPGLLAAADDLLARLHTANLAHARHFCGASAARQPVHTLYWPAHLVRPDSFVRLGESARTALARHGASAADLARALGWPGAEALPRDREGQSELDAAFDRDEDGLRARWPEAHLAVAVHRRVRDKLEREPIEDLRIDFEDGYGLRDDAEEDRDAEACARAVAAAITASEASALVGIRIKPLGDGTARRAIATLERFVATLGDALGRVPQGLRIMLPKVLVPEHVSVGCELLERLEHRLGLPAMALSFEFMVEVSQVLFDPAGRFRLPLLVRAGGPRLVAIALGVYDYTASCNVAGIWQSIDHPVCDLARGLMTLACAGTPVQLCDGSTNVLPIEPHASTGSDEEVQRANRDAVWRAWRLSAEHVRRSLVGGWVQGWDLHPAQIPVRFAACYRFYLEAFEASATRLRTYLERATAATDGAAVLDDAATGQALLGFCARAYQSGAVGAREIERTSLSLPELTSGSFATILTERRSRRTTTV